MAFDAFLKIDGIEGESTDKIHPGEIEIQSFSWGVSNTSSGGAGGGGGAGKASFTDMNFMSALSKVGPSLMLACATGRHFPSATLTCPQGRREGDRVPEDQALGHPGLLVPERRLRRGRSSRGLVQPELHQDRLPLHRRSGPARSSRRSSTCGRTRPSSFEPRRRALARRRGSQRRRAFSSRSIRRFDSRSAMSRRLSRPSLPRASASSTLARPSLK